MTQSTTPPQGIIATLDRLHEVDMQFRGQYAGKPVEEIIPAARKAFAEAGVALLGEQELPYATAVSRAVDYGFGLFAGE